MLNSNSSDSASYNFITVLYNIINSFQLQIPKEYHTVSSNGQHFEIGEQQKTESKTAV